MSRIIRKRLRFFGWVQGVGFRFRARHAAALAGATGWVSNEADGSVVLELQGTEAQIDQVIRAVERGRYIRIDAVDAQTLPVDPDERGFAVRGGDR